MNDPCPRCDGDQYDESSGYCEECGFEGFDGDQHKDAEPEGRPKTGWSPGMLQDDCRELSKWLSTRLGARYLVVQNMNKKK